MLYPFADILGQEKAKQILTRAFEADKLGHAYLFRGPYGVGKRTMARTLAAYINCRDRHRKLDLCGKCPSCHKFSSLNHPDFVVIEPEGAFIKIDQIRRLKKLLAYPPLEAQYRVVVIDEVHTMRREAANSLLKTLEEPPAGTILILTADEAAEVLSTITSRCQIVPFFHLPLDQVQDILQELHALPADEAAGLAAASCGSIGQALMMMNSKIFAFSRRLFGELLPCTEDEPEAIETVLDLADTAANFKENLPELLEIMKTWYRDMLLLLHQIAPHRLINPDLVDGFSRYLQKMDPDALSHKISLIDKAQKQLQRNCNRTMVCEVLFFDLL